MNEPISEMDKQLRDTPRVSLVIAIAMNKSKRNACLFLGIIALAVILFFGWSNWLLLLPAALGIGVFLYQMNILIVASELRRRSKEPEEREEPETPRRLTPEEIDERKRKLVFMKSHYDILVAQIAEYVEEHPDVSPEDAADYVSEKCFLEYEIAQLKG